jgi:hypothetical protein
VIAPAGAGPCVPERDPEAASIAAAAVAGARVGTAATWPVVLREVVIVVAKTEEPHEPEDQ